MNLIDRFNDRQREIWGGLKNEAEQIVFISEYLKGDFEAFVWMLGYRDTGEFHREQMQRLGKVNKLDDTTEIRRLWLWSRGFFKTSLITEAHSLFLIVNNPNIRILLISNTIGIAEDILRNIKNHMISNELFRKYFEEFCPKPNTVGKIEFGTAQDFTIECRTRALKEPTMMCAGIGTNITGLHFDYMKIDDLVTKDSVTNDTQIQASKDYYSSLRPLFDKSAVPREDVVGTIYHFNDLYSSVLRKNKEFEESFVPVAIDGKAVFPERLPFDYIEKMINDPSVGVYQVQTQYYLNPINPADAKFKEEWLKYYETINTDFMAQYILCDPASRQKKKSDYTVIQRWGIDDKGIHYLIEGVRDKFTSFQRVDKLFEIVKRSKNLKWVSYEVIGGRHGDLEIISQRQQIEQTFFLVKETKATAMSKRDRIEQRLVPIYHNGSVMLPRENNFRSMYDGKVYNFTELLKLEYLQFPFTEHDDILDCQAQIMEEQLIKGEKAVEKVEAHERTADDWEKIYKNLDRMTRKYPDSVVRNHVMFAERFRKSIRKSQ